MLTVPCPRNTLSAGAELNSQTMLKASASTTFINHGAGSKVALLRNLAPEEHIRLQQETNVDLSEAAVLV